MDSNPANRPPPSKLFNLLRSRSTLFLFGAALGMFGAVIAANPAHDERVSRTPGIRANHSPQNSSSDDSGPERAVLALDDIEQALAKHGSNTPWDSPDVRVAALKVMEAFRDAGEAHLLSRIQEDQWIGIRALLIEFARAKPSVVTTWLEKGLVGDESSFSALAAMMASDRGTMMRFIGFAKVSGLSPSILTGLYLGRDPALLLDAADDLGLEGAALRELQLRCGLTKPDLLLKCINRTGALSQQEKLQFLMALGYSHGTDEVVWKRWLAAGGATPETAAQLLNGLGPGTFAPLVRPAAELLAANATDTDALRQSLGTVQSRPTLISLGNEIASALPLAPADASAVIDLLSQNGCGHETQSTEQIRASLWRTYLNGLAAREPLTALDEWKKLEGASAPNDQFRQQFARALAAGKTADPQQLLESIGPKGATPDPGLLAAYVLQAAASGGATPPPHVSSWLAANEVEPEMLFSQIRNAGDEAEIQAGLEALASVSGANEDVRRGVHQMVAERWAKDPLKVAVWVEGMEPGAAQDQVLFAIAGQLQREGETEASTAWAARITDPTVAAAILTEEPK